MPEQEPEISEDDPQEKHLLWQAFFRDLPLQSETCWFLLAGMMDFFMTIVVLRLGAFESNPIANFFLDRWGQDGMLLLKLLTMTVVLVVVQIIARKNLATARRVLILGTLAVAGVVIYTLILIVGLLTSPA